VKAKVREGAADFGQIVLRMIVSIGGVIAVGNIE